MQCCVKPVRLGATVLMVVICVSVVSGVLAPGRVQTQLPSSAGAHLYGQLLHLLCSQGERLSMTDISDNARNMRSFNLAAGP